MYDYNILITNIGRRGYLVKFLKETKNFTGKVYVSDCDDTASGLYGYADDYFLLPRPVSDPDKYVELLLAECRKRNISIIIPVIDPEIDILSKYRDKFIMNGIFVAVSSKNVLQICYDKSKMNDFLAKKGFNIPQTYYSVEEFKKEYTTKKVAFPVIMKPILGSGSVSTYKVKTLEEMEIFFTEGMMIQEYIDGQEYGIDTLNDLDGKPVRCVVKKKISMRAGETDKALIVKDSFIQNTVLKLSKELGHICNLDCDILYKDDKAYVIDLNPRFGGGYPATHMSNVNYLELIIKMVSGERIQPDFSSYNSGILVMKEIQLVVKRITNS